MIYALPVTPEQKNFCKRHIFRIQWKGETKITSYYINEYEEITGLTYAPQLIFENESTYHKVLKQSSDEFSRRKNNTKLIWLSNYYQREIRMGYIANVVVKHVDSTKEYGLFADDNLPKGTFIGQYNGLVKRKTLFPNNLNTYCFRYPSSSHEWFFSREIYTIDARDYGNETSYLNHSSENYNCEAVITYLDGLFHACICTCRNISKGEELTYHYGKNFWHWHDNSQT